eukprot:2400283-Prymnesium_polylepis.1
MVAKRQVGQLASGPNLGHIESIAAAVGRGIRRECHVCQLQLILVVHCKCSTLPSTRTVSIIGDGTRHAHTNEATHICRCVTVQSGVLDQQQAHRSEILKCVNAGRWHSSHRVADGLVVQQVAVRDEQSRIDLSGVPRRVRVPLASRADVRCVSVADESTTPSPSGAALGDVTPDQLHAAVHHEKATAPPGRGIPP